MSDYLIKACEALLGIVPRIPELDSKDRARIEQTIQKIAKAALNPKTKQAVMKALGVYERPEAKPEDMERDCIRKLARRVLKDLSKDTKTKVVQAVIDATVDKTVEQQPSFTDSSKLVRQACKALSLILSKTPHLSPEEKRVLQTKIQEIKLHSTNDIEAAKVEEKFNVKECLKGGAHARHLLIDNIITEVVLDYPLLKEIVDKAVKDVFIKDPSFPNIVFDENAAKESEKKQKSKTPLYSFEELSQLDSTYITSSVLEQTFRDRMADVLERTLRAEPDVAVYIQAVDFFSHNFRDALEETLIDMNKEPCDAQKSWEKFIEGFRRRNQDRTEEYVFSRETFQVSMGVGVKDGRGKGMPKNIAINMKDPKSDIHKLIREYNEDLWKSDEEKKVTILRIQNLIYPDGLSAIHEMCEDPVMQFVIKKYFETNAS